MFTFKREKEIDRQVKRYIEYKRLRSRYVAERDREWLIKFCDVTGCCDVFSAYEKVDDFKRYLISEYGNSYNYVNAVQSLKGFLKFYRCIGWNDML